MNKLFLSAAALLLVIGGGWYWYQNQSHIVQIDSRDTIKSWDFQGSHADGGVLEKRVRDEIARLEGMLGGDQSGENDDPTDYSLYVGISGQYTLLGDGKNTLKYLEKALAIDSTKTGLAWHNVATLMERLDAINTAREAYARAVEAQGVDQYHIARIMFLMKYFSEDFAAVDGAIAEAEDQYSNMLFVHQLKAQWLGASGRLEEAITAWKKVRTLVSPEAQADVDREIQRLEKEISKQVLR